MLAWLLLMTAAAEVAAAWPLAAGAWPDAALAFDLTGDYADPFYGPLGLDYLRAGRLMGPGLRPPFGDFLDPYYNYGIYPRPADATKENYVRDYPYPGGTEFGVRDSVTYRPGASPWSRFYPGAQYGARWQRPFDRFYNPYDFEAPWDRFWPSRRVMASQLATARPSSLRYGGDLTYLK